MPAPAVRERSSRASEAVALRQVADQVFSRAAGAPLVTGNAVRVLRDARENYPAWEAAIASARRTVHVEMYIIHSDRTGRRFRDLLAARAREGVRVRLIYDWFGSLRTSAAFYQPLVDAGGEVRCMNPPRLGDLLAWTRRDHRKLITVDGEVAFVAGLCIGEAWEGDPEGRRPPWRDTGVEIRGPVVADAERAFADSWVAAGGRIDRSSIPDVDDRAAEGEVPVRLIATAPATANLLAMDLMAASLARSTLWITDAYFIATTGYIQALRRASADGVDVRLLLPASSDIAWIAAVSRTQYRPLLEAGVRIFEWNRSVLHAKTAVADSLWTRVGSTNLNVASWFGNWELDVAIEDAGVARRMAALFEEDLQDATEVVLSDRRRFRVGPSVTLAQERRRASADRVRRAQRASARRLILEGSRLGSGLRAVVTGRRELEEYEQWRVALVGLFLLAVAVIGVRVPLILALPVAASSGLLGLYVFMRASQRWVTAIRKRGRRS
jgi:phosphatidylserine/phosphatidylglycerophosphate/cardiolipin synthase-like enzyme